ncbi:MAG: HDOD domain-containing protein [Candidatus Thiodiazotropha sp.]
MTQAAHDWVRRLSPEPLPVLRRTLTRVRDLLNSSSVNHLRLSEIISVDPGFSLHLLQRLNALPNAPREPVNKISLAIPLLGMGLIEQACRTLPCLEDRLKGPPRRGLLDCYSRSAHAAIYASGIAALRGDQDSGGIYTAALLHELAEMALWSQEPEQMLKFRHRIHQGDGRDDAALEVFGCTFEEINVDLSERWGLPELVGTAQGMANSYLPRPLSVMLSWALARESSLGWMRAQTLEHVELMAEFLDMPIDQTWMLGQTLENVVLMAEFLVLRIVLMLSGLHRQAAEAARQLSTLPYPLPAFHLISGADLTVAPLRQSSPARAADPPTSAVPPRAPAETTSAAPPPAQAPETRPAAHANPLHQAITRALTEIQQGLGLQRAMFAMLNSEKTRLKARLVSETVSDHPLKGFSVDLTAPSLFGTLMQKPQAIALTPRNIDRYRAMIPPPVAQMVGEHGFFAMSVFLRNRAVGLFYADNGAAEAASERQFENFKAICQRAIRALA